MTQYRDGPGPFAVATLFTVAALVVIALVGILGCQTVVVNTGEGRVKNTEGIINIEVEAEINRGKPKKVEINAKPIKRKTKGNKRGG